MRGLLHKPLFGFTILLAFQWLGEASMHLLKAPIPGPVAGMVFLFLFLVFYGRAPGSVQSSSNTLLSNLALLFVPAAVGALLRLSGLLPYGPVFFALILLSTLFTLAVTAGLSQWLNSRNPL